MIPSGRSRTLTGQLTNPIDSHTVHIAIQLTEFIEIGCTRSINLQIVSVYLYMQISFYYVGKSII